MVKRGKNYHPHFQDNKLSENLSVISMDSDRLGESIFWQPPTKFIEKKKTVSSLLKRKAHCLVGLNEVQSKKDW